MARLYYLSALDSDLTATGDFSKQLATNPVGASSELTTTLAGNTTEISCGYTQPLDPGTAGTFVGDYTFSVSCTGSASNMSVTFTVARVNSSGTEQTVSAESSSVDLTTTGIKTTTLSSVDLGTFESTDRLKVIYTFTNAGAGNRSPSIAVNSYSTYVLTPFKIKYFNIS